MAVSHPLDTNEVIEGTDHVDYLDGGPGNDTLRGGDGGDVYVFGREYGRDRIEEQTNNILIDSMDMVKFGPGITAEDLEFVREGTSTDLIVGIKDTTDELRIVKQYAATYTGPFGKQWLTRVETFMFEDGSYLTWDEIARKILRDGRTDGDDVLYGFSLQDTIDGGPGNDFLAGGNENDTYIFGMGYGHDVIHDMMDTSYNISSGQTDKVRFGVGVSIDDVLIDRNGNSQISSSGCPTAAP